MVSIITAKRMHDERWLRQVFKQTISRNQRFFRQMTRSLTQGSITKNLLVVSIPTTIGFFFQAFRDLVDMIWVGRISSDAVAAVTIYVTIHWSIFVLNEVIGISSLSMVSQGYGANDLQRTKTVIEQTIVFKAILGIVAAILLTACLNPLLSFFTEDPLVLEPALEYGYVRVMAVPLSFSLASVCTVLRSIGDAKTSMIVLSISSILNLILDPVFMFNTIPGTGLPGLGLGVFGAALASVIAVLLSLILGLYILLFGRATIKISLKGMLVLDWSIDKKLLTIGLPSGFSNIFVHFFNLLQLKFISIFGTAAVAAMGIGNVIFGFVTIPVTGLVLGGTAIIGQNLGANQMDRIRKTAVSGSFLGAVIILGLSLVAFTLPELTMSSFTKDTDVIAIGSTMLRITIPGFMFMGLSAGIKMTFFGTGYNSPFLYSSILSKWLIQLPFLVITVVVMKLDIYFIWISMVLAQGAELTVFAGIYRKKRWVGSR